jgi:hypothetical protein
LNYNGEPYDAVTRRKGQELFYILGGNKVAPPSNKAQPKTSTSTGGKVYTGANQKAGLAASKNTQSTTAIKKSAGNSAEIQ